MDVKAYSDVYNEHGVVHMQLWVNPAPAVGRAVGSFPSESGLDVGKFRIVHDYTVSRFQSDVKTVHAKSSSYIDCNRLIQCLFRCINHL